MSPHLLRIRYPQHFGALLSPKHVGRLIPLAIMMPALLVIFGSILVAEWPTAEAGRLALLVLLNTCLLFFAVHNLRVLLGYAQRRHLTIPENLAVLIRPDEDWPRFGTSGKAWLFLLLAEGSQKGAMWIVAAIVWLVALVALTGIVSGDLTPG